MRTSLACPESAARRAFAFSAYAGWRSMRVCGRAGGGADRGAGRAANCGAESDAGKAAGC
jgi:hypothetical protein